MRSRVFGLAVAGALITSAMVLGAEPDVLAGSWSLNPDASDDAEQEFRMWMKRGASASDAAVEGGPPGGGGGGNFGGGARGIMGMMQSFTAGGELLKISYEEPELIIERANGSSNMVFTDGRLVETEAEDGGSTKVKTRWKKDKLTIGINFPSYALDGQTISPNVSMTYRIDKQGRLEMGTTVGVGGRTPPFTIKLLYDPVS